MRQKVKVPLFLYDTMSIGEQLPTFRVSLLPPPLYYKESKNTSATSVKMYQYVNRITRQDLNLHHHRRRVSTF